MKHKKFLNELFDVAINAALPEHTIKEYLPDPPTGRTVVIGCGKAAATMAVAFEKAWDAPVEGVVVTRYGHKVPTQFIEVREASHPIPDEAGMAAAIEIQALIVNLTSND